jgi:hypothetical protein
MVLTTSGRAQATTPKFSVSGINPLHFVDTTSTSSKPLLQTSTTRTMEIDKPEERAQSQVQVKFVTRDTETSVPTAPILVPSK